MEKKQSKYKSELNPDFLKELKFSNHPENFKPTDKKDQAYIEKVVNFIAFLDERNVQRTKRNKPQIKKDQY